MKIYIVNEDVSVAFSSLDEAMDHVKYYLEHNGAKDTGIEIQVTEMSKKKYDKLGEWS